jgi:hypothetical protein
MLKGSEIVVRRIHESGFEDSNLFANFAGEREDSIPKAKDSNLCCQVKRPQNCSNRPNLGNFAHVFALAITNPKYMPF